MLEITPSESPRESEHQAQIQEFVRMVQEKGFSVAIDAAKNLNNPHFLDDLHDALAKAAAAAKTSAPPNG